MGRRGNPGPVRAVADALRARADALPADAAARATFLGVYGRVTLAVADAVVAGRFEDPEWVSTWDEVFADLFLAAHDADLRGGPVPRPWRLAFGADPALHPLGHLLLAMNAHINFDLAQSLVAVVDADDFADPGRLAARDRDHQRIDEVLFTRVRAEDAELGWKVRRLDRALAPANRWASRRFLRESREKVWHNTAVLHAAREAGGEAYADRVAELDVLTSAKVTEFLRPGPVLLRLAVQGFGVTLPPA